MEGLYRDGVSRGFGEGMHVEVFFVRGIRGFLGHKAYKREDVRDSEKLLGFQKGCRVLSCLL